MRAILGRLIWLMHLTVFVYGAIGWLFPMPWLIIHLVLVIIIKMNWQIFGYCLFTKLETYVRADGVERIFSLDLFHSLGWKSLTFEQCADYLNKFALVVVTISLVRVALIYI